MSIDLSSIRSGLQAFESLAYAGRAAVAVDAGIALCEAIQTAQTMQRTTPIPDSVWVQLCTRASSAWMACLNTRELQLSVAQVQGLAQHRYTFQCLFAGSGFQGSRVLLETLAQPREGGGFAVPKRSALTLAATLAVEWIPDDLAQWAMHHPDAPLRAALVLGWLAQASYTTPRAEQLCNALLEHASEFTKDLSGIHNLLLLRVWMGCSYFSSPRKHEIKTALGAELARRLPLRKPKLAALPAREKPVLLVVAEAINRLHPVYRSYAPALRRLRERFHTVLLCQRHLHDEEGRALFDEVLGEMGGTPDEYRACLDKLADLAPDAVFFPAVGMVDGSVALANLRLAPVQMMTLGHPASSMSPNMDYVLMPSEYESAAATFSECVVLLDGDHAHAPAPQLPEVLPRCKPAASGPIRIALNSAYLKLSPLYLDACVEIARRAQRPVEFHFFPSRHSLYRHALNQQLQRVLPGCVVHEECGYAQHLANLADCHLSLAAFPFGNSNSTVDAFLVGLPVVAMRGDQVHGLTDARKFGVLQLPEWLLAANRADYVAAALRLIGDEPLRQSISDDLSVARVRHAMFGEGKADLRPIDLAGTMEWLVREHRTIQASGRRLWRNGQPVDKQPAR